MSRNRLTEQVKTLQQKQAELTQEVHNLVRLRRGLHLRHALLNAWCDSLSMLQLCMAQQHASGDEDEAEFKLLLHKEVQLLQQLTAGEGFQLQPAGFQGLLVEADVETIAPCTDPMLYLRQVVSKPLLEESASMSCEQYATFMHKSVLSVSIKMHQLEGLPPWERPDRMKEVAAIWDRYMHCITSLVMRGRQDIVERAHCLNLESMQPDSAAAGQHQAKQAAVLVPLLGLSEQQQELVAAGMRLYFDLEHGIHQERQDMQAQMEALEAADDTSDSSKDAASSSGAGPSRSSSNTSSADGGLAPLSSRRKLLAKQHAILGRLQLLLQKEYILRLAAMGWFVGCLSYEQLSRLAVMSWPFGMRVLFLAAEIMQQRERLVQQRLELSA